MNIATIKHAEISGYRDSNLNKSVPGLTIIITPIKPIKIADVRRIPILSPSIGTARNAAIIGAESFGFGTWPMIAMGCKYLRI